MNEFAIIKNFFAEAQHNRLDVIQGIGDDAAILAPQKHPLVITTDTLIAGVHFPLETAAYSIGYKTLAVNLSDLAAMGAKPLWATLALTLPSFHEEWLTQFCEGFFELAHRYDVQLIGGDLTRGPLSMTVTALGTVSSDQMLLRSAAKTGDLIYVTGTLGDAGLALACLQNKYHLKHPLPQEIIMRLEKPEPRILQGQALLGLAHAAIDISDGLASDLNHILTASEVGAMIYVDALPLSLPLKQALTFDQAMRFALTAGDDYELCFTISPNLRDKMESKLGPLGCPLTCIGQITEGREFNFSYQDGRQYHGAIQGYQHF